MAVRIGELLLREKRITPEQLQEALTFQRQNGGRLGFNLIKLGFVQDSEITSLLIFIRLDEYSYGAAAALASVLLIVAFLLLFATNSLQAWALRHARRS